MRRSAIARARSGQSELATLADARANGFAYDPVRHSRRAPMHARASTISANGRCATCKASIDWTPFFRAWELAGNYPAILDDAVVGESARSLFDDAQAMLDQIIAERWVTAKATVGLWRCKREGDDVLVLAGNDWVRVPFLRQQVKKREGRPNMCLADFIDPEGEDWIGGFAVGIHGIEPHLERFKADNRRLFGHPAEGAGRPPRRKLRRSAPRRGPQAPVGLCRRASLQRRS